jgi:tetratricopeptide (TPR) repeat protein
MSEPSYPIACRHSDCGKPLYGQVKFCPYCGRSMDQTPIPEHDRPEVDNKEPQISSSQETGSADKQEGAKHSPTEDVPVDETPKPQDEPQLEPLKKSQDVTPEKKTPEITEHIGSKSDMVDKQPKAPSGKLKWFAMAAIFIFILFISGYYIMHRKDTIGNEESKTQPESEETTGKLSSSKAKCETEFALAQEALRYGVQISVILDMINKQKEIMNSAKKLVEISDRYKPQFDEASNNMHASLEKRDKAMNVYRNKVMQLSSSNSEQVVCALDSIRKINLDSSEKIVVNLITGHIDSLRKGKKPNQKSWLADFNKHFGNINSNQKSTIPPNDKVTTPVIPDNKKVSDENYVAQIEKADEYISKKDFSQAYDILSDVIEKTNSKETKVKALVSRGILQCENMDQPDTALQDFQTAIKQKLNTPDLANAHYYIGWIYYEKKNNPQLAIEHLKIVLDKYPNSPIVHTARYLLKDAEIKMNN